MKIKIKLKDSFDAAHTAKYLWTWIDENGQVYNYIVDYFDKNHKLDGAKEYAMKLIDKDYTELKKEVDKLLLEGYNAKKKRLNEDIAYIENQLKKE